MSEEQILSETLSPSGAIQVMPTLREMGRFEYRLVLEGVATFAHSGEAFDALYRSGADGSFSRRHEWLSWSPAPLEPFSADRVTHRYEFVLPKEWAGQSVGLGLNIDALVSEFLIPPSEARAALTGSLRVRLLRVPLVVPFSWGTLGAVAAPVVMMGAGLGFILRRRRLYAGLAPDLRLQAERLEQKHRTARASTSAGPNQPLPTAERLDALREGGQQLIRRVQSLRETQRSLDRRTLVGELDSLRIRLAGVKEESARREGELALAEKRKSLELLDELAASEAHCTLRLTRIEALFDSATLSLRHRQLHHQAGIDNATQEALCRDLDAELAALHEVTREVSLAETPLTLGAPRTH